MRRPKLAVVTATTSPTRGAECWSTWDPVLADLFVIVVSGAGKCGVSRWDNTITYNLSEVCGTVKPFMIGCGIAQEMGADFALCLHDDVEILDWRWRQTVREWTRTYWNEGQGVFFGFGGALGLASDLVIPATGKGETHDGRLEAPDCTPEEIVRRLARREFVSNMKQAEAHGRRVTVPTRVACLDGFSIGGPAGELYDGWSLLDKIGIIHHAYDSALGCYAKRIGAETWMLPVSCHHRGGVTAVGDPQYQAFAATRGGDQVLWMEAHKALYREFKWELPIRV